MLSFNDKNMCDSSGYSGSKQHRLLFFYLLKIPFIKKTSFIKEFGRLKKSYCSFPGSIEKISKINGFNNRKSI